jgi:hypothetical protein
MSRRRGASLAELLLIMSASSIILTMSAGILHRAMHAQSRSRSFFDIERASLRLSKDFRRDVHSAKRVNTAGLDRGALVSFTMGDDEVIEYRRADVGIERTVRRGGQTQSREDYSIPQDVQVAIQEGEASGLVVLSAVESPVESALKSEVKAIRTAKSVSIHVEARLGADLLFSRSQEGAE